jgi:hypothetical protein
MKKLAKAQMGSIVKAAAKTATKYAPKATEVITKSVKSAGQELKAMNKKVIPKGLPATIGSLAAAGYVARKVYGEKKPNTTPKKKMGGSKKSC